MANKQIYVDLNLNRQKLADYLSNPLTTTARTGLVLSVTDKGYVAYDTTQSRNYIWNGTTWVGEMQERSAIQTLVYSAAQTWDVSTLDNAVLTLTASMSSMTVIGAVAGRRYTLMIIQGPGGSKTGAFGTSFRWPSSTVPALTLTAGKTDMLYAYYDGTFFNSVLTKNY